MKSYEMVWEIFNQCPNNQMRDVFIEEVELEDIDAYLKKKLKGKDVSLEKSVEADGTVVINVTSAGLRERYTFTEL